MRKYRTWHEILIEDLADPAEAIGYLDVSIEEYQMDGDTLFFLRGIQNVIEAQGGVVTIAKQADMSSETLSKILSSEDAPHLDTFATILKALGCRLSIELLKDENFQAEKVDADAPIASSESIKPDMVLTTDHK